MLESTFFPEDKKMISSRTNISPLCDALSNPLIAQSISLVDSAKILWREKHGRFSVMTYQKGLKVMFRFTDVRWAKKKLHLGALILKPNDLRGQRRLALVVNLPTFKPTVLRIVVGGLRIVVNVIVRTTKASPTIYRTDEARFALDEENSGSAPDRQPHGQQHDIEPDR